MTTKFFDSKIMSRFGKAKVAKEKFYGAKKTLKIWDVDVDDIVIWAIWNEEWFSIFYLIFRWSYMVISFDIT